MGRPKKEPTFSVAIRVPESWKPEIGEAAKRRGITPHAYLLKAVRRVLDGEPTRQIPKGE